MNEKVKKFNITTNDSDLLYLMRNIIMSYSIKNKRSITNLYTRFPTIYKIYDYNLYVNYSFYIFHIKSYIVNFNLCSVCPNINDASDDNEQICIYFSDDLSYIKISSEFSIPYKYLKGLIFHLLYQLKRYIKKNYLL